MEDRLQHQPTTLEPQRAHTNRVRSTPQRGAKLEQTLLMNEGKLGSRSAAVKAGWFRTNIKYSQVKILGGLWKTPAAKSSSRNTQDFLADNAYDQDKVWPRVSRLPAQIAAVLSYIIIVVSLMG